VGLAVFLTLYFFVFASVVTCPQQDGKSLSGLCVQQTLSKAEAGDARSRRIYAQHLHQLGDEVGYQTWIRKLALQNQDLPAIHELIQFCRQGLPGFSRSDIVSWVTEAGTTNPSPTSVAGNTFPPSLLRKLINDKTNGCAS
jgi:hypothetical protein